MATRHQRNPPNARQRARILAGLNQDVVANHIGMDGAVVSRWERGFYRLDDDKVRKIARLYRCAVEDLDLERQAVAC